MQCMFMYPPRHIFRAVFGQDEHYTMLGPTYKSFFITTAAILVKRIVFFLE
jgi:hypothetical protein